MSPLGSIRACSPSARRNATATRSTCGSWRSKPACCADANPRRPITSASSSRGRLAARPAMNSRYRCAGRTTAPSIGSVTKKPGGSKPVWTPQNRPQALETHPNSRPAGCFRGADARCRRGAPCSIRRARPGDTNHSLASAWPQQIWLTAIGLSGELFYVASGTAFADIVVNGHRETWPIRSKRFRTRLRRCH